MSNYDLTYEGSEVQSILDTGDKLREDGYILMGGATPSTLPGTPTKRVAYIGGPGSYSNFGTTTVVPSGSIGVFKYTGSAWSNQVIACTVPISTSVEDNDASVPTGKAVKAAVDAVSGAVSDEATAREEADGALQTAINNLGTKLAEGYIYVGIATPTTNPGTPAGKVLYIATTAGTYTNFLDSGSAALVLTQGINILKFNGTAWAVEQLWGVDDEPTAGSENLVKSGGVFNDIMTNGSAFDLSAYNNGTTYADLNAALTALNALPADFKRGGMSIKFVLTSDNKYVQFRCIADEFTTDVIQWQGSTNEIKAGSKDLAESGGVYNKIHNIDFKIGDVEILTPAQNNVDITEDRVSYQVGIISDSGVIDSTYTKNTIFYFNVENILRLHGKSRIYLDSGKSTYQISFYSSETPSQSSLISLVNKYEGSIVRIEDFDVFVPEGAKIAGISSTDTSSNSFQVIADKGAVYNDLQSQISKGSLYDNLKDDPTIVDIRSDLSWDRLSAGSSRVTDNGDGTYTFTRLSASGGGAYSKPFVSNSDNVRIKIDAVASNGNFGLALFGILEDQSQIGLGNLYQGGSETHTTVSFDAAYLNVYRSTVAFKLQVFSAGTQAAGDTVTYKISVYEGSEIEKTSIYDKDFEPMMVNIDNFLGLKANKSDVPIETILISPNGNKFILNVDNSGNLTTSPITPNKVVFVGNSLLAGMGGNDHGGFYGMCASSPYKDYAYYVEQEILTKNQSAVFTKVHGGGFEQSENMDSVNSWWNGNNIITGQPTKNAFTSDIDLVIIQLGDNINNSARVELLNTSFDVLINNIRQNSPSARIIWVDGWFNAEKNHTIISSKCNKWKIPNVFIKSLNTTENQGVSGMISTRYDGTTFVVPDTYISHPGDNGFELIADMIISVINM